MPSSDLSYINNPTWDNHKKTASRRDVIIKTYREYFGKSAIAPGRQYWTMCGAYWNKKSGAVLHGELGQLVDEGLITRDQFHGVDRNAGVIEGNSLLHPDISWHHGDFKNVMSSYPGFDPAIINYDGVSEPVRGTKYLKNIMKFIDHNVFGETMVVANFVMVNPYNTTRRYTGGDVLDQLYGIYHLPKHWTKVPGYYPYDGSTKYKNGMGMFVWVKARTNI